MPRKYIGNITPFVSVVAMYELYLGNTDKAIFVCVFWCMIVICYVEGLFHHQTFNMNFKDMTDDKDKKE